MEGQLGLARLGEGSDPLEDHIGVADHAADHRSRLAGGRRMQGRRVAVPPAALLTEQVPDDVVRAAVVGGHPGLVEQLRRVLEVGEHLTLSHPPVHPFDDLPAEPAQRLGGAGQPLTDLVGPPDDRPELGHQGLGAEGGQCIEGLGPPDREPLCPQRRADVGNRVAGSRRPAEEEPVVRVPDGDRVVGLRRRPKEFDGPTPRDDGQGVGEGLRGIGHLERRKHPPPGRSLPGGELHRRHAGLQVEGLAVAGIPKEEVLVGDEPGLRFAPLGGMGLPGPDCCVVAQVAVAVADGVQR